jgi:hypothetical protein
MAPPLRAWAGDHYQDGYLRGGLRTGKVRASQINFLLDLPSLFQGWTFLPIVALNVTYSYNRKRGKDT